MLEVIGVISKKQIRKEGKAEDRGGIRVLKIFLKKK